MTKIQYKVIAYLIILFLVISIYPGNNSDYVAFAQEATENATDEQDEDKQEEEKRDENEQGEDEQGEEKPDEDEEEPDEKAPEIAVFTNPEVNGGEEFVPIIIEAALEYTITVDEPCDVILHIEKTTIVITDGKVTTLKKTEDREFALFENLLEYSATFEEEGEYAVYVTAQDAAGNKVESEKIRFMINRTPPVITAECDRDYAVWSNQDIIFHTTVADSKVGIKKVIYKANGKTLKKITFDKPTYTYDYDLTVSENADKISGYPVTIEAVNNAGLSSTVKRKVYIDKEAPKVFLSGVENGTFYNEDQLVNVAVQDISYDNTEVVFVVKRTLDGQTETMSLPAFRPEQYEATHSLRMIKEGVYQIHAIATDGAGNIAKSNTLSFVIDKTAPELKLSGVKMDSVHNAPVGLQISCVESFYMTNNVSIQVVKRLDGKTTTKELTEFSGTGKESVMQHAFVEDGIYCVTVSATDKAGNTSSTQSLTFSVDRTKPEIKIRGTGNYEQWGEPATIRFVVVESFYQDNTVIISGTRRDMYGTVSDIDLPKLKNTGKTSTLSQTFKEDGIYAFKILSKDKAGNESHEEIHFTIDRTAPRINGIKKFDGGCYPEFKLADTLDEIFEDLTVISYRILLNGVEYNGTDTITEEGKYNLYVTAKDELGHTSSEMIEFMIVHTVQEETFSKEKDVEDIQEKTTVNRNANFVYNSDNKDEPQPGKMGLLFIPICLCIWLQVRKRKGKREKNDKGNCI